MPTAVTKSAITQRANAFVNANQPVAEVLGTRLADVVDDPEAFVSTLLDGLRSLADPEYLATQRQVAPGLGESLGVRLPLLSAVRHRFDRATRRAHPDSLLWLANRLLRSSILEVRVITIGLLTRLLPSDPERSWQLLRQAADESADWITVDILAHAYGAGILLEPRRWAEIEQLVYSDSPWERRLVGSTIATIPFVNRTAGRAPAIAGPSLDIIATLIGDADPNVQKALSWALRSVALIDRNLVAEFCQQETERAVATNDGHRSWVIRDALRALDPQRAGVLRARLDGLRRRPGSPATSQAARVAPRFAGLPHVGPTPERRAGIGFGGRP
ncbi:MAG TPA: DNA alkylation repair protein [Candidatus Saccharimonadales bacterium]|nr:DNA alkylation repair protein [Candidatus Saccharimonadales bacterium]